MWGSQPVTPQPPESGAPARGQNWIQSPATPEKTHDTKQRPQESAQQRTNLGVGKHQHRNQPTSRGMLIINCSLYSMILRSNHGPVTMITTSVISSRGRKLRVCSLNLRRCLKSTDDQADQQTWHHDHATSNTISHIASRQIVTATSGVIIRLQNSWPECLSPWPSHRSVQTA